MTQGERLLDHLEQGKTITRVNAWEVLGILEAPARICELRQKGHKIDTEMVPVFNRFNEVVRVARWSMLGAR